MLKKELTFVTGNPHKVEEVNYLIKDNFKITGLKELDFFEEIPETSDSIQGNAIQKAQFIFDRFKIDCFAEDTGLEVDFLGGKPGIHTARYAGPQRNANENMDLLLKHLDHAPNRDAQFRTVVALFLDGELTCFEGIARGKISEKKKGAAGFGYDPIFIPNDYQQTFAELSQEIKNEISHRGKAVRKLISFLSKI